MFFAMHQRTLNICLLVGRGGVGKSSRSIVAVLSLQVQLSSSGIGGTSLGPYNFSGEKAEEGVRDGKNRLEVRQFVASHLLAFSALVCVHTVKERKACRVAELFERTLLVKLVVVGGLIAKFSGLSRLVLFVAKEGHEASSSHLLLGLRHEGISF